MLAHLQACEPLLIAFWPPDRLKLGTPFQVDRQETGVKTHRIGRGICMIQQTQSGRLHGLAVALRGFQAWETPPCTELLALHVVVESEAPTRAQQGGTALQQV